MGLNPQQSWAFDPAFHVWREKRSMPMPRTAKAMRLLLGLSINRAARLARVNLESVRNFEALSLWQGCWADVSVRLHDAYTALGATWGEHDLHEGAHFVTLKRGRADDRRAIRAALALMGHSAQTMRGPITLKMLAERVAWRRGIPAADLLAGLQGKAEFPAQMVAACFEALSDGPNGAGCYFYQAEGGFWRAVGCDWQGCRW